ncbi:MAG TPA: phosphoribosylglycinamide formyltransferase [Kiloniellales bacterium]|nr:phosphoribosylglycinamide formyltransferase [Kiloniellales bacterium]
MGRVKTAVLISGRGSNLGALLAAAKAPDYPAEISLVVSNRAEAAGLDLAAMAGVPTRVLGSMRELEDVLATAGVRLTCLAGFMRLIPAALAERWRGRMLNIHPSLLPAFPGLDTHARALAAGVRLSGCSVHFVSAEVDAGPIIGQAAVPVLPEDTAETLAARVLAAEHRLYPRCLALVAAGRVRWEAAGLVWQAEPARGQLLNPA